MKTKQDIQSRIAELKDSIEFYNGFTYDERNQEIIRTLGAIISNMEWILEDDDED